MSAEQGAASASSLPAGWQPGGAQQAAPLQRSPLAGARVVLGVTGSIAAYKAVALASALTQAQALVDVILTREATELVRPLSFQAITHRPAYTDLFHLRAETEIGHVTLGHEADVVVIAPATAHTLARLALGLGDDLLATTVLATRAPLVLAPAMETNMLLHPATQGHLATLRERGALIVEPGYGHLASGAVGAGRLAEPEAILDAIRGVLARGGDLAGWRVVVTAGGTQEPIDPVRVIANRSSGKMGYAVAEAARDRGAAVTLVTAPTALRPPGGVQVVRVATAAEMCDAVLAAIAQADALVMAAAVADFQVAKRRSAKIKKDGRGLTLDLVPTPDILAAVAARPAPDGLTVVGFAAESEDLLANARAKLQRKRLDLIVANDVTQEGSGFGTDTNQVALLDRWGGEETLPLLPKLAVAHQIWDRVRALRERAASAR
ncbi:MAG TPA: bifunctional phosphopantothenoylcysteine decarboxylase/phosphopantothenate--cysteine ligase CoaBC [Chloroflexota bacterium]|nr:bifunctional phosphopantothenoylcysteine decarboxylase/phosphopantothenate--cysteine ligase CoaBC [Chloroflexota bacterium]